MRPFALAGLLRTHGVECTNQACLPGKSELHIGGTDPVRPKRHEGGIWRVESCEVVPCGPIGFGRIALSIEVGCKELAQNNPSRA
eukprot:5475534-Prymnesium_polylepis.1